MNKKEDRLRRARKTRIKIREAEAVRLCVHRSTTHMYAQIIVCQNNGSQVVACASTLDKEIQGKTKSTSNIAAAKLVGNLIATRAKKAGIEKVAFDRSGFKYHGRVKALADGAREGGLNF